MITATTKKDFQKVIGAIRKERQVAEDNKRIEYPKAMMTGQQEAKNTATVNCGGEWGPNKAMAPTIANMVLEDERFKAFLNKYEAKAHTETNSFGAFQIRINF